MREFDAIALLQADIAKAGNIRKWAKKHKFSAPFVGDVLNGKRALSDRLAASLGLERNVERIVTFKLKQGKSK